MIDSKAYSYVTRDVREFTKEAIHAFIGWGCTPCGEYQREMFDTCLVEYKDEYRYVENKMVSLEKMERKLKEVMEWSKTEEGRTFIFERLYSEKDEDFDETMIWFQKELDFTTSRLEICRKFCKLQTE